MKINEKTWPLIEARINKLYEEKKIKLKKSEVYGQKPVKQKRNK